jgi:putative transposase
MCFELFDPKADVRITGGNLPHWYQPSVTYFITLRTADSIPADVGVLWHRRRDDWLRRHGIDPNLNGSRNALHALPDREQREFHNTFSQEFLRYLDLGCGECVLKRPELAGSVSKSLLHFDGVRYHMGDFVVMPNHIHMLVCLLESTDLEEQCYSWKKFTATEMNHALGRQGEFWQYESFDHLVQSPAQFDRFQCYIADNPSHANLREGEYLYYKRPK